MVTAGHTLVDWDVNQGYFHRFIYAFHMPLFFGIAGAHVSANSPAGKFFWGRFFRLVVPFFFWSCFYFAFGHAVGLLRGVSLGDSSPYTVDLWLKFLAVLYKANWDALSEAGVFVDLWFLPALFSAVLVVRSCIWVLSCLSSSRQFVAALILSVLVMNWRDYLVGLFPFISYWGLDIAVVMLPVMLGFKFGYFSFRYCRLGLIALFGGLCVSSYFVDVSLATLQVRPRNMWLFYIGTFAGVGCVVQLSQLLVNSLTGSILASLGEKSLGIYVLSGVTIHLAGVISARLFAHSVLASGCLAFAIVLAIGYVGMSIIRVHKVLRSYAFGEVQP